MEFDPSSGAPGLGQKTVEDCDGSRHVSGMASDGSRYLTTDEAAMYLRRSVSWILRQGDVPYLKGRPNLYAKRDLDDWFERHKYSPRAR